MLNDQDFSTLAGAATARLFSAMVRTAQETEPVDRLDSFISRNRDLLADLQICLRVGPEESKLDPDVSFSVAHRYCDHALGEYVHDTVALTVERGLSDLRPVFSDLDTDAATAIDRWLEAHGKDTHTLAWLTEQTTQLLVADAAGNSAVHRE